MLALFYLIRGRIRIEHGFSGRTIERFSDLERMGHWLMAVSFIILGLTGLNVLYGKYVLLPVIGKEAFAGLSILAKWLHNYVAFAFMAGLAADVRDVGAAQFSESVRREVAAGGRRHVREGLASAGEEIQCRVRRSCSG